MTAIFQDLQQLDSIMNGVRLTNVSEVITLFRSLAGRKPFLFELQSENGFTLTIGLAQDCASVQYSSSDGLPPYLMALASDTSETGNEDACVEFLAGNTPTPIPRRFCLPIQQVEEIVKGFLIGGVRSEAICWEEI
jgi:hypothetical protein